MAKRGNRLQEIEDSVRGILEAVRQRGDAAVKEFTQRFDGCSPKKLEVSSRQVEAAAKALDEKQVRALKSAARNIQRFAKKQLPRDWMETVSQGVSIGELVRPLEQVGCYVPGGRYPLPSSVLMTVVPAKTAGVGEVVVCTPPQRDGRVNEATLAACFVAGADRVFSVGGAQAIAAMAYGTESVSAVDKIVGPGNAYVTAAKKLVFGDVGIDFLAGPTELLIIADRGRAEFLAADLLAQAEHDVDASAVLVTTDERLARDVAEELEKQLEMLPTAETARASMAKSGAIMVSKSPEQAVAFANRLAPEHLVLVGAAEKLLGKVKNAGAVFLGEWSPEAAGDYAVGPNHVLPTNGVSRFRAGLSARDFVKTPTIQSLSREGLLRLSETIETLAELEGLFGHAKSVAIRRKAGK